MKHLQLLLLLFLVIAFVLPMNGAEKWAGKKLITRYNRLTQSLTTHPSSTIHNIQFVSPESLHVADSLGGTYSGPRWTCQASPVMGDTFTVTCIVIVPSAADP